MIICGLSRVDCHVYSCVFFAITSRTGPATAVPVAMSSGAAQILDTSAVGPSLFFQCSHGLPSASMNGCGSMLPPMSSWQMIGPLDASENGPMGDDDVATVMHHLPADCTRAA